MEQISLAAAINEEAYAPSVSIVDAYQASKIFPYVFFKLFGNEILAKEELKKIPDFKNYEIIHTDEYIKSDD